jgi:hypothetical protein
MVVWLSYAAFERFWCRPLDGKFADVGAVDALFACQTEVGHFGRALFGYKYISEITQRTMVASFISQSVIADVVMMSHA